MHAGLTLTEFLAETDVDLADLYGKGRSWTLLRREVGLPAGAPRDREEDALENVHKLLHVGDTARLDAWERFLRLEAPTDELGRRLLAMLFAVLYGKELALTDRAGTCGASTARCATSSPRSCRCSACAMRCCRLRTSWRREGRRHLDPAGEGCTPLLFVRVRDHDRPGVTAGFQYLGPAVSDGAEGELPTRLVRSVVDIGAIVRPY